jgi:uncharacterized protein
VHENSVRIVWDEFKRRENRAKHGMDFGELDAEFFSTAVVTPSREGRFVAIGVHRGETALAVVFRPLGAEAISLISMRPASRKERTLLR